MGAGAEGSWIKHVWFDSDHLEGEGGREQGAHAHPLQPSVYSGVLQYNPLDESDIISQTTNASKPIKAGFLAVARLMEGFKWCLKVHQNLNDYQISLNDYPVNFTK